MSYGLDLSPLLEARLATLDIPDGTASREACCILQASLRRCLYSARLKAWREVGRCVSLPHPEDSLGLTRSVGTVFCVRPAHSDEYCHGRQKLENLKVKLQAAQALRQQLQAAKAEQGGEEQSLPTALQESPREDQDGNAAEGAASAHLISRRIVAAPSAVSIQVMSAQGYLLASRASKFEQHIMGESDDILCVRNSAANTPCDSPGHRVSWTHDRARD
jgi:hypothetical protein